LILFSPKSYSGKVLISQMIRALIFCFFLSERML